MYVDAKTGNVVATNPREAAEWLLDNQEESIVGGNGFMNLATFSREWKKHLLSLAEQEYQAEYKQGLGANTAEEISTYTLQAQASKVILDQGVLTDDALVKLASQDKAVAVAMSLVRPIGNETYATLAATILKKEALLMGYLGSINQKLRVRRKVIEGFDLVTGCSLDYLVPPPSPPLMPTQ
jgi:hypothetical protein